MNLNLKSIFSFSVLFFFMQSLSASDNGANQWRNNQNVWQDQTINGINRLPSRSTTYSFRRVDWALDGDREKSEYMSLNGQWKFNFSEDMALAPAGFYKVEYNSSSWKTIPVPSCWEMQGYGYPIQILFILSLLVRHILTGIIRRGVISRSLLFLTSGRTTGLYSISEASIRDLMYG